MRLIILTFICSIFLFANNLELAEKEIQLGNYKKAFNLYQLEVEQTNNKAALFKLGMLYYKGKGVEKDFEKAYKYIEQSANLDYSDAAWNMAVFNIKGEITPINVKEGYQYLLQADRLGIPEAKVFIKNLEDKRKSLKEYFLRDEEILSFTLANIEINDISIKKWMDKGLSPYYINYFLSKNIKKPDDMVNWIQKTDSDFELIKSYIEEGYTNPENAMMMENVKLGSYILLFILIIAGIALGAGEKRKIIVFQNYDDLGVSFLVPVSYVLIIILFPMGINLLGMKFENTQLLSQILALSISGLLLLKVIITTFKANKNLLKTFMALLVKFPLSLLWVFALSEIIKPSGKTQTQRRENRSTALLILTLLTPIISLLVVEKTGIFNPKQMVKGRRIGSGIRNQL